MRIDLALHYPPSFAYANFLEDHVHALVQCVRRNGWSVQSAGDATIVLGAHTSALPIVGSRTIVLNTERTRPYVHGLLDDYVNRLRGAAAVWSLYEDDTAFLRAAGLNAFTWTYGPDVSPRVAPTDPDPEFDVFFNGSVTPHRGRRLQALERAGLRVTYVRSTSWVDKCHRLGGARAMLVLAYDSAADYLN